MLRARQFSSHQEVLVLGIYMYTNGVRRDTLGAWLRGRYRSASLAHAFTLSTLIRCSLISLSLPDLCANVCSTARCVGGEWQKVGPLPEAWLRRLHTYLERVDWDDPTLWTYSLAEEAFVYLDGRPKELSEGIRDSLLCIFGARQV